jgi:hypothetical protein
MILNIDLVSRSSLHDCVLENPSLNLICQEIENGFEKIVSIKSNYIENSRKIWLIQLNQSQFENDPCHFRNSKTIDSIAAVIYFIAPALLRCVSYFFSIQLLLTLGSKDIEIGCGAILLLYLAIAGTKEILNLCSFSTEIGQIITEVSELWNRNNEDLRSLKETNLSLIEQSSHEKDKIEQGILRLRKQQQLLEKSLVLSDMNLACEAFDELLNEDWKRFFITQRLNNGPYQMTTVLLKIRHVLQNYKSELSHKIAKFTLHLSDLVQLPSELSIDVRISDADEKESNLNQSI